MSDPLYRPSKPVEFRAPVPAPASSERGLLVDMPRWAVVLLVLVLLFTFGSIGAVLLGWVAPEKLALLTVLVGCLVVFGGLVLALAYRTGDEGGEGE